jgi:ribosomal protein S18 acetylase RimI-like enzyme
VATIDDAETLSVLATEVWLNTYAKEGISPAFAKHLLEHYSPAAFTQAFNTEKVELLLCCREQFILGYVKLVTNQALIDLTYGTAEIATLYVRGHHRRSGIGALLLQKAIGVAAKAGPETVFVTVHHANRSAIAFYEAQQFRKVGDWVFQFEGIEVPNWVMALDIKSVP